MDTTQTPSTPGDSGAQQYRILGDEDVIQASDEWRCPASGYHQWDRQKQRDPDIGLTVRDANAGRKTLLNLPPLEMRRPLNPLQSEPTRQELIDTIKALLLEIEPTHIDWAKMHQGPDHDPSYKPDFPQCVVAAHALLRRCGAKQ